EAARQCGRGDVPQVLRPVPFDRFVREQAEGLCLLATAQADVPVWHVLSRRPERPAGVTMAVGPVGGFTRRERDLAAELGFVPVSLGRNVLRVETAAVCLLAAVVLCLDGAPG
ncbi:MAG: RsmE family RNA methyltransferase, partial [Candidatus Brocadiia bacterium]